MRLLKLNDVYKKLIQENNKLNQCDINNGKVLAYHYSDKLFDIIDPNKTSIRTPSLERGVSYYFCNKNDVEYDATIPTEYRYTIEISPEKICGLKSKDDCLANVDTTTPYNYLVNANRYGKDFIFLEARMGKLKHEKEVPLLISNKPMKPIKIEKIGKYGWEDITNGEASIIVGYYNFKGKKYPVYEDGNNYVARISGKEITIQNEKFLDCEPLDDDSLPVRNFKERINYFKIVYG